MGHVGRFDSQKNQDFLLDIAAALLARTPDARFLLVGDGVLRRRVEQKARTLGIADRVVFAGTRSDVPRLMLAAMDVFVLPSRYEGLPLVMIEAQAAGLPCVLANTVAGEADIIPRLVTRLGLSDPPSRWADAISEARHRPLTQLPQFERRDPGFRAAPGCKSEPRHTGDRNGACSADQVH